MNYKVDDLVFCRVDKVEGTTVFVEVDKGIHGTISFSEIAAGRIRNLREYVYPNKKIVCKVLRVVKDHLELSFRRVTAKEREEVLERHKTERALISVLEAAGEDAEKVIGEIKDEHDLISFLDEARNDSKMFDKYVSKGNSKKIFEMIQEKEKSAKGVRKTIVLRSLSDRGVSEIKEILDVDAEIHYTGSGTFSVEIAAKDFKEANSKMAEVLKIIEERAKQKKAIFEIKK